MMPSALRRLSLVPALAALLAAPPGARADEPADVPPSAAPAAVHPHNPIATVPLARSGRQLEQLNGALRSANRRIAAINAGLAKGQWYKDFRQTVQALLDDLMVAHTVYHYKPAGEKARNVVILFKNELLADDKVRYLSRLGPIEIRVDPAPKNIESWNFSYLPVAMTNTNSAPLTRNFLQYVKFYVITTQGFQDRAMVAADFTDHKELLDWIKPRGGISNFTPDEDLLGNSSKLVQIIFPRRMAREEIAKVIAVLDNPKARMQVAVPFWENIKDSDWPKFI